MVSLASKASIMVCQDYSSMLEDIRGDSDVSIVDEE
jgi:hypothetical protein